MTKPISILVPSLSGGISHQPPAIRFPNQVTNAINFQSSIINGASKRPGTQYVETVSGLTSGNNYRMHGINRDEDERYLVIYGDGTIRIIDKDGNACTVIDDNDLGKTYLNLNSPTAGQLRFSSIADFTIAINTTVQTSGDGGDLDYDIDATKDRIHIDYEIMSTYVPDTALSYHQCLENVSSGEPKGFFQYIGDINYGKWTGAKVGSNYDNVVDFWNNGHDNPHGFRVRFQRQSLPLEGLDYDHVDGGHGEGNKRLYKSGAPFANYAFATGDEIHINAAGDTPLPEGFHAIASRVDDDAILLSGVHRTTADVVGTAVSADAANSDSVGITTAHEVIVDFGPASGEHRADPYWDGSGKEKYGLFGVAQIMTDVLQAETQGSDKLIAWVPDNKRRHKGSGKFEIRASSSGTDASGNPHGKVLGIYTPVGTHKTDLSAKQFFDYDHADAVVTDSSGTAAATAVVEDVNSGAFTGARWQRIPTSGQDSSFIDEATMPIRIDRTVVGPPATFTVKHIEWKPRFSGLDDSNPLPSLIKNQRRVKDATFHRNRLVLVGDENIVFSEVGEFFNFFIADAANLTDADPIDRTLGEEEITLIDFITPFRNSLLIQTTAARQFDLNAPEKLTNETASIIPTTSYETISVRPKKLEDRLYFVGTENNAGVLYEYFYDDTRVSNQAFPVSNHAFRLLPTSIQTLEVSRFSNTVYLLGTGCNSIWVYQPYWSGNRKDQSAWQTWEFSDTYKIHDIAELGGDMYLLVEDLDGACPGGNQFILEKVSSAPLQHVTKTDCHTELTIS